MLGARANLWFEKIQNAFIMEENYSRIPFFTGINSDIDQKHISNRVRTLNVIEIKQPKRQLRNSIDLHHVIGLLRSKMIEQRKMCVILDLKTNHKHALAHFKTLCTDILSMIKQRLSINIKLRIIQT